MSKRLAVGLGLIAAVLALAALPASAHEEINPRATTVGTPTFFTLSAANEEKADLVKVTVEAPSFAPFGATTKQPTDWTATVSEATITFTGGAVKPDNFETFGFETDGAKQAGDIRYKVTLTWSDGKSETVTPPAVTVAAAGSSTSATKSDDSSGKATAALVLAIVGLVAGLIALFLTVTRRGKAAPTAGDGTPTTSSTW